MKKFILAAVLALPLAGLVQQQAKAGDHCTPLYRVGISVGLVFRGWCGCDRPPCPGTGGCGKVKAGPYCGGGGGCGGPWYCNWPYPAHFQTPAPTGYPYWPAPMTYGGYSAAPQMMQPAMAMGGMEQYAAPSIPVGGNFGGFRTVQPVGYAVPAYYGYGQ